MAKLSKEGETLYDACMKVASGPQEQIGKAFFQEDLLGLNVCKKEELMLVVQELSDHSLFRTLKQAGRLCWTTRTRDAASHISTLDSEEKIVYGHIEDSHTAGIWTKKLKQITHIPPTNVQKAIAKLEKMRLIKAIKSVKSPAQRIYMLFHLAPSEDVTGGSFFDAGDLDESLVEELSNLIIFRVRMDSWVESKRKIKRERSASPSDVSDEESMGNHRKRKRSAVDIEDAAPRVKHRSREHDPETDAVVQIAYPAGSRTYPTAADIHHFVTTSDAIRPSKASSLTIPEVQGLMDVLVWDEKLERAGGGYRTVRGVSFKPPGAFEFETQEDEVNNGFTEAPCGRCSVFDLCSQGGPVNAANCVYFEQWLHG